MANSNDIPYQAAIGIAHELARAVNAMIETIPNAEGNLREVVKHMASLQKRVVDLLVDVLNENRWRCVRNNMVYQT